MSRGKLPANPKISSSSSAPDRFLWGAATSGYQAEGGYNGQGKPQTNWAGFEENQFVMPTGCSADFWSRYEEDFARCKEMGLSAFRLGLEWSRVQPALENRAAAAPDFDFDALDHYVEMVASCRRHGLEPIVTLHHFVHPAWLGEDPWLSPEVIEYFYAFVEVTVGYVNDALTEVHGMAPIGFYLTINEPNMLALNTYVGAQFPGGTRASGLPMVDRCYNHLLAAHVRAYNCIHDLYAARGWTPPAITLNNYASDSYWGDKFLLDLLSLRENGVQRADTETFIRIKADEFRAALTDAGLPGPQLPIWSMGGLAERYLQWLGNHRFVAADFTFLLDALEASPREGVLDYIALDYYDPFLANAFRFPVLRDREGKHPSLRSRLMHSVATKWWNWKVLPRGLNFFCSYYAKDFGKPVLIAENGMALRRTRDNRQIQRADALTRSEFLRLHVGEVIQMVEQGIPLIGYLHWSLFDNYEWGTFTPRFGLFSIDYTQGTERIVEDFQGDRPSETYAGLIREARRTWEGGEE